jgi:hypothetical protein
MSMFDRRAFLLMLLIALASLAPALDVAVFGVHEHLAASESSRLLSELRTDTTTPSVHHCDFSVNPGDAVWMPCAMPPLRMTALSEVASLPAARHTPLVPVAPPRA